MSETAEILKRVRQIEIRSRGLSDHLFTGQYHSAFKGKGMSFSEVREYQYGDAIRNIDWNVTARLNHPFIKQFQEERELTVMLLVDVSASNLTGSGNRLKQDRITEIAALLAFSAIKSNDKVGVVFFSDQIEKFIPPKKGAQHILLIIRQLLEFKPINRTTRVAEALKYISNIIRKRCIAFLITDFLDTSFEDALNITNQKHDLVAVKVYDPIEVDLPELGLVHLTDAENGSTAWIDTTCKTGREAYAGLQAKKRIAVQQACRRAGVDLAEISTAEDYIRPLLALFGQRGGRR
jgi:uncharacterized protein (DUF58 family)